MFNLTSMGSHRKEISGTLREDFSGTQEEKGSSVGPRPSIPSSISLMLFVIHKIILTLYIPDHDDVGIIVNSKNGKITISFYSIEAPEDGDVYSDPDFHNALQEFMNNLQEFNYVDGLDINERSLSLSFTNNLSLFSALHDYICNSDEINAVDTISFSEGEYIDDEDLADGEHEANINDQRVRYYYRKRENYVKEQCENPEIRERYFFAIPPTAFSSKGEFLRACFVLSNAEIQYSLAHILKTIQQEDNLKDHQMRPFADLIYGSTGGYN